ncbi:MAG: hypothetical protein LBF02_02130, partial [Mycoplasmataceae bacterium]|nr:hypothetical protein [Mycoplasmataceae bacterium]
YYSILQKFDSMPKETENNTTKAFAVGVWFVGVNGYSPGIGHHFIVKLDFSTTLGKNLSVYIIYKLVNNVNPNINTLW